MKLTYQINNKFYHYNGTCTAVHRRDLKRFFYLVYQSTQHITMPYINLCLPLTLIHTTSFCTTIMTAHWNCINFATSYCTRN